MAGPLPKPRWAKLFLIVLPLWLFGSGGFALWYFFHREKKEAMVEQQRFAQSVSTPMLADDLKKLIELIGERNGSSEKAAQNLTRTASMIEGLLGPSNTGYQVKKEKGPAEWPLLQVTVRGKNPDAPAVWIVTSYDSRPGSPGAEANASGLAATLAAAQALATEEPRNTVHFVFLPHLNDPEAPLLETATKFKEMAAASTMILCVEAMGAGDELWLSSRDTEAIPLGLAKGLGTVRGAETVCLGEDTDLSSILFEIGLPAVRVATRAVVTQDEPDQHIPPPAHVAASAGRLVELIRRCHRLP